jgi:EAL domain-containing protein (putative c-di-GMP-specific phosphodiesterase class I)/AmiR/NasT family two-component response regulator
LDIAHLHFLVAEDDPAQRRGLVEMLGQLGASQVTEVPDGHTALRCFEDTFSPAVGVAIIDLDLPGMDALDLIRSLAADRCTAQIIVIGAQSSNMLFSVETMAQAYGLDLLGTIPKPVSHMKLENLLSLYVPHAAREEGPQLPAFTLPQIGAALAAGQFEPYFQPKIELATGHVRGLEVFARWNHPEHGVLGPQSLIDVLQANDRVDLLDWSMIEKSVERCKWFEEQGTPVTVSLNLAPATIAHPQFVQQISACVARHRVMPDYITIEMPESAVLTNDPSFLERLVRLRLMGFGMAIDDYGAGRSNLQLLARVPFSELKIDRSFVDGASKRRPLGAVLSSCLSLARSLDRDSVAVGVETKRDWDFLQSLGCTYAQGYHIAKPMQAEAFPGWLEDWRQFF